MAPDVDLAVIGSGFGGSILSMIGRRIGLRVALLERGRHPRFAIGESASPLAGVVLAQLAARYDLPALAPLASYGEWQRRYPGVGCGLKRGFTYFKHRAGEPFAADSGRSNQLLVAASPNDEISDTHWLRADVDHLLVREAAALGVEYYDETALEAIAFEKNSVRLTGRRYGSTFRLRARNVIDASGPRGFLSRALDIPPARFDGYPLRQSLFAHFTGVARCQDMAAYDTPGDPPYPVDAAALHHVFDDGWMWVLRFGNGVTSAGVAVSDQRAQELRLADGAPAWQRLLAMYPTIAAQFAEAEPIRPFTYVPRLDWRTSCAAGDRWAMLPSAAALVDPLFSTGIPQTLLGIERLARGLEQGRLPADYGGATLIEADHTARFVGGCYAAFPRFDAFAAYSMFYFAAASFTEMARRLRQPTAGFLLAGDRAFAFALEQLSPQRGGLPEGSAYERAVAAAVERINIAGLCDPGKRNWYRVDLEDTVRGAHKLGVDAAAVRAVLASLAARGAAYQTS